MVIFFLEGMRKGRWGGEGEGEGNSEFKQKENKKRGGRWHVRCYLTDLPTTCIYELSVLIHVYTNVMDIIDGGPV